MLHVIWLQLAQAGVPLCLSGSHSSMGLHSARIMYLQESCICKNHVSARIMYLQESCICKNHVSARIMYLQESVWATRIMVYCVLATFASGVRCSMFAQFPSALVSPSRLWTETGQHPLCCCCCCCLCTGVTTSDENFKRLLTYQELALRLSALGGQPAAASATASSAAAAAASEANATSTTAGSSCDTSCDHDLQAIWKNISDELIKQEYHNGKLNYLGLLHNHSESSVSHQLSGQYLPVHPLHYQTGKHYCLHRVRVADNFTLC
jgi:hypothetical protein